MYSSPRVLRPSHQVISTISEEALGSRAHRSLGLVSAALITWAANLAVFVPFGISEPFLVREVWWFNGSGAGGNIDVGVYDTAGTRLFSLGSTAKGTVSVPVTSTGMTDYTLSPGDYFLAFASDSATASLFYGWAPAANLAASVGVGQMASAFALPSSAAIVPLTNALLPYCGLNGYTVDV